MPSAGAIQPPRIVVMKDPLNFTPSHKIDTETYVELLCETPYTKMYFTTDGTKPNPFQIGVAGRESTFKYKAPFTLNAGKRMLKAIAISRDGLQESAIVTKTFLVHEPEDPDDSSSVVSASASQVTSASSISVNSSISNVHHELKKAQKNDKNKEKQQVVVATKAPTPASRPATPRSRAAWSATPGHDGDVVPEGPFNPTNYSGTQINLWGLPTEGWQPLIDSARGIAGLLPPSANSRPFTPQPDIGFMTSQMMKKLEEQRVMTVADVRRAVQESIPAPHVAPPRPVEQPVIKSEPELKLCSPGNGNWREQVDHIYAHLIDYARSNPDFRTALGEPRMGKILDADFVDGDHDTIVLTVAISRYGIPKTPNLRTTAKVARAFNKPAATTAKSAPVAAPPQQPQPKQPPPQQPPPPPASKATPAKMATVATAKPAPPQPPPPAVEVTAKDPDSYFVTEDYKQEGTLKPYPSFNAEADCQALHTAMKGIGTDEDAITAVLSHRSATQRMAIVRTYKTMFGKDLVTEMKSEFTISGNYLKVLEGLCLSPAEFDAFHLRAAMKGLGTDEQCLIEIICTRTNEQLKAVKEAFKRLYSKELEATVVSDTSGRFKNLLVSLLQANREESPTYDQVKVKEDAQRLLEAGELKKWGTEESTFNAILVARSYAHLRAMFEEYQSLAGGKSLEDSITSETSGDFRDGLLALVRCIRSKPAYFASVLYKTMKGLGTDDMSLQRVVVSRCEIDMVQIKQEFEAAYKQTLAAFIIDDTSGHFRKVLLALIGDERAVATK